MTNDYPRMMFHRSKDAVTVYSREEEDGLGKGWSRTIWMAEAPAKDPDPAPIPEPVPGPEDPPEPETEPDEEVSPVHPRRPVKPPARRPAAAKTAHKKR